MAFQNMHQPTARYKWMSEKKISKEDLAEIAKENLLPSGSRVMEDVGKKVRQVYPAPSKPKKIIKGNIAKELEYDNSDDPLEEYRDEDSPIDDESIGDES